MALELYVDIQADHISGLVHLQVKGACKVCALEYLPSWLNIVCQRVRAIVGPALRTIAKHQVLVSIDLVNSDLGWVNLQIKNRFGILGCVGGRCLWLYCLMRVPRASLELKIVKTNAVTRVDAYNPV